MNSGVIFEGVDVERGKSCSLSISPFSVDIKKDRNNISCHPVLTHARYTQLFKSHPIATEGPRAGLEQHFRSN